MADLFFTTKQQVIEFLLSRNQEDHEIKWKCPACGTENIGAYYSRGSPCGGCGKFVFPRLNLKELLKDDIEASEIAREIKEYSERVVRQKEIVESLEGELSDERGRLDDLRKDLRALKSCDIKKVRDW